MSGSAIGATEPDALAAPEIDVADIELADPRQPARVREVEEPALHLDRLARHQKLLDQLQAKGRQAFEEQSCLLVELAVGNEVE